MKKVWHPYWLWEDWKAGMWRKSSATDRPELLKAAIEFTGDAEKYGEAMMEIVKKWKYACEHNLTDTSTNKLAWIGHAATAFAINCPEDITRQAWGQLSQEQQDKANAKAQAALNYWIEKYEEQDSQLCLWMETEGV
jgi:hypothetical protein